MSAAGKIADCVQCVDRKLSCKTHSTSPSQTVDNWEVDEFSFVSMGHLSQENNAHECEGKSCWILIDGLDFYKCKAEKVIV